MSTQSESTVLTRETASTDSKDRTQLVGKALSMWYVWLVALVSAYLTYYGFFVHVGALGGLVFGLLTVGSVVYGLRQLRSGPR